MDQLSFLHNSNRPDLDGTSGKRAVMTGQQAENVIWDLLRRKGLSAKRQVTIGKSIYDQELKVDFLIRKTNGFPDGLIIESKWQSSRGSVDEKYPYLVENIRKRYPCPAVVVLGGGAAKLGAIDWFRNQVDGQKLIGVFSIEEFMSWAMDNL